MFLQCADQEARDLFALQEGAPRPELRPGLPVQVRQVSAAEEIMGDKLPREIENPLYRYLIAISKLLLGILTEQGEGS